MRSEYRGLSAHLNSVQAPVHSPNRCCPHEAYEPFCCPRSTRALRLRCSCFCLRGGHVGKEDQTRRRPRLRVDVDECRCACYTAATEATARAPSITRASYHFSTRRGRLGRVRRAAFALRTLQPAPCLRAHSSALRTPPRLGSHAQVGHCWRTLGIAVYHVLLAPKLALIIVAQQLGATYYASPACRCTRRRTDGALFCLSLGEALSKGSDQSAGEARQVGRMGYERARRRERTLTWR